MIKKDRPRMNEFLIDRPPRPFKNESKKIKSVKLSKINLTDLAEDEIKSGKGFVISNETDYDEKKKCRTEDGLYSPKFGVDAFNDKTTDDMYHCECGQLSGGVHDHEICPNCGTEVQCTEADLSKTGWISCGCFYVITPACYIALGKLIGTKDLENILKYKNSFDIDGNPTNVVNKSQPYSGIGMIKFKEKFDEIIEYYHKKKKQKQDEYETIMMYKDAIFTKWVPVYTSLLRPYVKEESRMSVFDVNKKYSIILVLSNIIRRETEDSPNVIGIEKSLFEIQTQYNEIFEEIVSIDFAGKSGLIRSNIICVRSNFSGRLVIVPATFFNVDEISIPYIFAVEELRPIIINYMVRMDKMGYREANNIVDAALRKFDKKIYLIMSDIINSDNPPMILVQRSPTLLQESIRLMKIKMITLDYYNLTMATPSGILSGMNADYDGDTFAAYTVFDNRLKEAWEFVHSPRNHFISRLDGKYSGLCKFIKDNAVVLTELWELGKNTTYYNEWATESEVNNALAKDGVK